MKKIIIDTNLLLLLVLGGIDNHKYLNKDSKKKNSRASNMLSSFCKEDYIKIYDIIEMSKKTNINIYITNYIAAEVSNLIGLTGDDRIKAFIIAKEYFTKFKQVCTSIRNDSDSSYFCNSNDCLNLGITDSSLIELLKVMNNLLIITNDEKLYYFLILENDNYRRNKNIIELWKPQQTLKKLK